MIEQYAEAQWDMNMSRKRTEADRGNFGSSVRGSYLAVRGMFYRIGGLAGTWWNGMLQWHKMDCPYLMTTNSKLISHKLDSLQSCLPEAKIATNEQLQPPKITVIFHIVSIPLTTGNELSNHVLHRNVTQPVTQLVKYVTVTHLS